MKTDLYTKAILTVIAVCLVLIVLRDIPFYVSSEVVNVRIVEMPRVEVCAPFSGFEVDVRDMPGLDIDRMPSISVR